METSFYIYLLSIGIAVVTQVYVVLRGLYYLWFTFPHKLRPQFQSAQASLGQSSPSVSVFIPCKGHSPDLEKNITAMLYQNYPNFSLFYITESMDDPAAGLLSSMACKNHRFHHVIAGRTTHCCQKNHNLLKAIDYARQRNMDGDIFVFVDMDGRPKGDWLSSITLPLSDKTVFAVTGFGSVVPKTRFSEHLHAAFNGLQGMAMTDPRYAAMWGGAMAIRKQHFEAYDVYHTWSTAVVDDMALTAVIKRHGLKRIFSPDARVISHPPYPSLKKVFNWMIRQTQYAAIYLPLHTFLGICLNTVLFLTLLMGLLVGILTCFEEIPWFLTVYHLILYALSTLSIGLLSSFGNHKIIQWRWILYAPVLLTLGTCCTWIGYFSKQIDWADFIYDVNSLGKVLAINHVKVEEHQ